MTHSIGYYVDQTPQISALTDLCGHHLQLLTKNQKREVQAAIACWINCGPQCPLSLDDVPDLGLSDRSYDAIEIIQGMSVKTAQNLLVAIAVQLSQPNNQ
jgi:hypothetical protein